VGGDAGDVGAGDQEGAAGEGGALGGEGREEEEDWVSARVIEAEWLLRGLVELGLDAEWGRGVRGSGWLLGNCF
jgi:hypothetical protein